MAFRSLELVSAAVVAAGAAAVAVVLSADVAAQGRRGGGGGGDPVLPSDGVVGYYTVCSTDGGGGFLMRPDGSGRIHVGPGPVALSRGESVQNVVWTEGGDIWSALVSDGGTDPVVDMPDGAVLEAEVDEGIGGRLALGGGRIAYYVLSTSTGALVRIVVSDLTFDNGAISGIGSTVLEMDGDDYAAIGSPDDSASGDLTNSPGLALSVDGGLLALSVYGDLWLFDLDSTSAAPIPLTRTKGVSESQPAFSSDHRLAFMVGDYASSKRSDNWVLKNLNVGVMDPAVPLAYTRLLGKSNVGDAGDLRTPGLAWSPDGQHILFVAVGARPSRQATCGGENWDLFAVPADGTGKAVAIAPTVGTADEAYPSWGWTQ